MPGRSPAPTGRSRRRSRGWSTPYKASRRPQSPTPSSAPPLAQQPPLPPGTEVEVRVDDDGFHGSWFEAKVDSFLPARGRGSRARYTVTYSHLLSDDSGGTLVEPFAPSHIRPRPPPPSNPEPLCLHDIVEAFHNDGWWSGILLATDPLTAAFPITREVITFQDPHHVRHRRDYVDGQWLPSKVAISVQPKRAVRVYAVGDKVEVVRDRDLYGYSWFPATVAKVIDRLSYLVEYSDLEEEVGGGKAMEYLHCLFIRPDVEHSPRESEFHLGPGAAVEVYCDGAWSPGVVQRAVGEGEYEVSINGKEGELLLKKVPELLKPQYKWNGKHWRIVSPKRQGNRRQSVSGKRPSSAVEVASNDDENGHHTQSPATKRSRKELPRKKHEELTEGSEHVLESEMDTSLSALRKSLASNFSPKSCSPRSRKNNFQAISRRIVDSCTVPMKGLGVHHASSENPTPQNESRADGIVEVVVHASSENPTPQNESRADGIVEVVVQEAPLDMMLSNGQLNSPVCGTVGDEAHDMLLTAVLRKQKMDSSCINNAVQKPQESPLDVQPLQVKKFSVRQKGGETHPIQALEGNSDTFDNIQLKGKSNSSCKEIICALTASTCNAPSPLDKQARATDAVSRGADSSSNTKVFASKKSEKKGVKGLSGPHSSVHGTRTVQKRSAKKVAGRQKECFMERQVDSRGPHTQQQLNMEEKVGVNDGTNHELFPLIPPGFKLICNGQGLLHGEKVDERPIQLHIQDAGSSQCTMENTALRSCSAVGTSLHPPFLSCQISGERFPFIKTSSIWHHIEPMEVFRKVPQEPHFLPLQQFMPELREGMAIGLMVTYDSLVESVKRSCIEDSIELFERKINALAHLEEHGFDVKLLQHSLMKLLEAKWEHTKHLGHLDELKELVPRKESAMSQKHALLVEKEGAIFQLEQKLEYLRGEAEQIARETKDEDAELLRLKVGVNMAQEACVNVEVRFHDILADMSSRLQLSE
ncbi:DUF724 domain-containing protein 3-like isoform X2 [Hordeum vulgare subsp. vulgare]|uniref:Predicted protein n=1 Tax=Hordeum vulgare subsp. vulgare TaxID=112509 RepID=F2DKR9_HORVV|nr:DUF724 domain-containing protein 3-like isoform X2 [Hordeum vulgare subsp. vulgare]BAJ95690.1 predicted protein [Hordeum vulgare subsp. vulgare]